MVYRGRFALLWHEIPKFRTRAIRQLRIFGGLALGFAAGTGQWRAANVANRKFPRLKKPYPKP